MSLGLSVRSVWPEESKNQTKIGTVMFILLAQINGAAREKEGNKDTV